MPHLENVTETKPALASEYGLSGQALTQTQYSFVDILLKFNRVVKSALRLRGLLYHFSGGRGCG
jgi:hypothetical protein